MRSNFGCPVQATANVMAGKWKVMIVWHLSFGSQRFAEIRDFLPGVSEKVLTAQLRELQKDGVVERVVTRTKQPRVDYMLTDRGKELVSVMETMCLEHKAPRHHAQMASAHATTGVAHRPKTLTRIKRGRNESGLNPSFSIEVDCGQITGDSEHICGAAS